MHAPSHFTGRPISRHYSVDVTDPMVSFVKSRRAIAGTLNKLQIPDVTHGGGGHCFNGTATPAAMCCMHTKEEEQVYLDFLQMHLTKFRL